ncbi:MAG: hypothetical protein AAB401_20310 [Acidobacteriota bacterium]
MGETKKKRLKMFPHIEAKDFQHPWDATATDALKSVPGLDKVIVKILGYGLERIFYLENTASNVRVTQRRLPQLNRLPGWGCWNRKAEATIVRFRFFCSNSGGGNYDSTHL